VLQELDDIRGIKLEKLNICVVGIITGLKSAVIVKPKLVSCDGIVLNILGF
jgi:hypothetical protein